jgi:hypothetical protein
MAIHNKISHSISSQIGFTSKMRSSMQRVEEAVRWLHIRPLAKPNPTPDFYLDIIRYRDFLHDGGSSDGAKLKWKIVFLAGSFSLIEKRVSARVGHFMPASLLKSQFEALEEPTVAAGEDVLRVSLDSEQPIDVIAEMASIWVLGVQKNGAPEQLWLHHAAPL